MTVKDADDQFFRYGFWPIPIGLVGGGFWLWGVAAYPALDEVGLNTVAFWIGAVLALLYIGLAAARLYGGRNWQARMAVVAPLAAIGWIALTLGVLPVINGFLGGQTPETHYAKVVETRHIPGKKPDLTKSVMRSVAAGRPRTSGGQTEQWLLIVEAWLPGYRTHMFEVRQKDFLAVQVGTATHMEIVTRSGRLGYPWLVSVKVANPPAAVR